MATPGGNGFAVNIQAVCGCHRSLSGWLTVTSVASVRYYS